jgi:Tol biopolymer transport system component
VYSSGGDILWQRAGGTTALNLTRDKAGNTNPAYSPDGQQIAFRSNRDGGGIYVMGATGENPRPLTSQGSHPSWSPDGTQIAASTVGFNLPDSLNSAKGQLIVIEVATGRTRVIEEAQDVHQPNWSPHGYQIAYWGRPQVTGQQALAGQRDLWTVSPKGGPPTQVTNDDSTDWNPVWSSDGRWLYFCSNRGGSMNLWRLRMDEASGTPRGQPEPVTTPATYTAFFSISRDGRRIAYTSITETRSLSTVEFDPSREAIVGQPTAIPLGTRPMTLPDVSPDGQSIVAQSFPAAGQENLIVVRPDGTVVRNLTNGPFRDRAPKWSPDGKSIAFHSDRSGSFQIWMIDSDGKNLRQFTAADHGPSSVVWGPLATRMIVRTPETAQGPQRLLVLDVRKRWNEQTPEVLQISLPSGQRRFIPASWSGDERQLVLELGQTTYIYDFETKQVRLVGNLGELRHARWLSDNRRLLVVGQRKLQILDSVTGNFHELFSLPPDDATFFNGISLSRDHRRIVYALHDSRSDIWLATAEDHPAGRQR